ncbi:tyrosine-type recombinase/integrase [Lelliottia nimipressuralis]|uniref:Site-specific integrase n=1 Tax=Lelliottia nimipressuralis TaxID=69220 RepID=A0ABD4KAS3_9ENTR|nr:site-specific integrase [Lelliottia nimipressuralis]MBF4178896.1 site-specific integrase [Lelliottia nimipressuralis]
MAFYNLEKRKKADGTLRYRCVVGIKEKGVYTHRESKTFSRETIAKAWGSRRVLELESGIASPVEIKPDKKTIASLIDDYLKNPTTNPNRAKVATLKLIARDDLGGCDVLAVTSRDVIEFGRATIARGCVSSTVAVYIACLISVFDSADLLFNLKVNIAALREARAYMFKVGIAGQSSKRNRRPTSEEVDLLYAELKKREPKAVSGIPLTDIFMFSILSCMRVGEVCRIKWDDVDYKNKSVIVRDRKDPRKKLGNHMIVPLLGGAWDIIEAQKKTGELIFPFRSSNISYVFQLAKKELGIKDLRYHDLRREGASRLFELGFSVEEVAQVTGHKNLQTLWTVYREIYPQTLHDRFDALTASRPKN